MYSFLRDACVVLAKGSFWLQMRVFYLYDIPCKTEHIFCNLWINHAKYILLAVSAATFAVRGDLRILNHGNLPTLFLQVPLELVANVSHVSSIHA